MMMDFNGNNRGYAFVTFSTKQEAKVAMKQLNNYEIRFVQENNVTNVYLYCCQLARAEISWSMLSLFHTNQ